MYKLLLLTVLLVLNLPSFTHAEECRLTSQQIQDNLKLGWNEFDQTQNAGHRAIALKGCYLEAAELIDVYNLRHRDSLEPSKLRALYFHAGQMYAYAELNDLAASRMMNSINPNEEVGPELNWNDYVQASVAFLRSDRTTLEIFQKKLQSGKPTQGNKVNLGVVNNLVKCFGKPYSWPYGRTNECK